MVKPLTGKQESLLALITQEARRETALAYIALGYTNKKQAYLDACEKMGKTPSKNPETSASEMLSYPNVIEFINSVKLENAQEANISAKYVLNRLIEIDQLDVIDIVDCNGALRHIRDWPKSWRTSISGLDIQEMISGDMESIVKKIKWPDKLRNLDLLGKHVDVKAWDKEQAVTVANNIMPVPTADSVESWEEQAKKNQEGLLGA